MGAEEFYTEGYGASVQDAFDLAREQAKHEHGHSGYTGTLAEKDNFVILTSMIFDSAEDAKGWARALLFNGPSHSPDESTVHSKYGPAGAVRFGLSEDEEDDGLQRWLFFGVASS